MNYDTKKAIKRINKLIGFLSDEIIKQEDSNNPNYVLIQFFEHKQGNLTDLRNQLANKAIKND